MNIRRGLFRLWVVFAAIFIIAVFLFSFDSLDKEFKGAYISTHPPEPYILMVPIDCKETRGKKPSADEFLSHYEPNKKISSQPVKKSDADFTFGLDDSHCWYELPKFRMLYPEYKNLDDNTLQANLYDKAGIAIEHYSPWRLLSKTLAFAVGIPLLLLVLGKALFWTAAGFRNKA